MATGYEDIDRLTNQQNNLINEQERKQNELINQQTQMQVDELNREKDKIEQDTIKTTKGLYSNWQKQANQYGANAEQLAQQGLAHSGYAETTQTALYNTYQKNVTETLNNARDLKSDYDFKVQQARQNGSVQQAQAALDLYKQKAQLLTQNYELRQNREQYLYQQERDRVSDNQWQKQYELSKKKSSSASSSKSSKKSTKSTGGLKVSDSNITEETDPRLQRILKNAADVGSEIGIGSMKILNSLMGRW